MEKENVIIQSYKNLISACKSKIKDNIEVETNSLLKEEYEKILQEFTKKLNIEV